MADITKCTGINEDGKECKMKHNCYRYTAKSSDFWQSYFTFAPFTPLLTDENGQECKQFWNNVEYKLNETRRTK